MNIRTFAEWYKDNNYPHDHRLMNRVVHTDVTTSVLVYSKDEFIVELYFVHPNVQLVPHTHTFENLVIFISGELTGTREGNIVEGKKLTFKDSGLIGTPLPPGQWHSFRSGDRGCVFYNVGRYEDIAQKDSAVFEYIGTPLGPIHAKLLAEYDKTNKGLDI